MVLIMTIMTNWLYKWISMINNQKLIILTNLLVYNKLYIKTKLNTTIKTVV